MDWIPKDTPARLGIDHGGPDGDSSAVWLRQGSTFMCELKPGDGWTLHPAGGVIIANPEHSPRWVREEGGKVVDTAMEPAQPSEVRIPWGSFHVGGGWSPNRLLQMPEDEQRRRNQEAGYLP